MTKTDDFLYPSPNHFHISVNGHPTAPIVGPKSLGLTLIPLSHSTYVNHQQVLLTYSSKYFQNLTTLTSSTASTMLQAIIISYS